MVKHALDFDYICEQYRRSHHRGFKLLLLFYLNVVTTVILIICLKFNRLGGHSAFKLPYLIVSMMTSHQQLEVVTGLRAFKIDANVSIIVALENTFADTHQVGTDTFVTQLVNLLRCGH